MYNTKKLALCSKAWPGYSSHITIIVFALSIVWPSKDAKLSSFLEFNRINKIIEARYLSAITIHMANIQTETFRTRQCQKCVALLSATTLLTAMAHVDWNLITSSTYDLSEEVSIMIFISTIKIACFSGSTLI